MKIKKLKFCFKIGCPRKSELYKWGDYYLARSFGEELRRKGHNYIIQILPQWHTDEDSDSDVVIHLRGLSKYKVKDKHFNIMWNISHPDDIEIEEYEKYDLILVSSIQYAKKLKEKVSKPVYTLLQFTDTNVFYPDFDVKLKSELLFVGNSRRVMRKAIQDVLPPPRELSVYGTEWENLIPAKYIKAKWFPNEKLRKLYSSCDILLNDHWDDMREYGFINNRVFDALACKTILVSDDFPELRQVLPEVLTYKDRKDLLNLIDDIYKKPNYYKSRTEQAYKRIIEFHTVERRVNEFLNILDNFKDRIHIKQQNATIGLKSNVKRLILSRVGYGKAYIFAQKVYQCFKQVSNKKAYKKKLGKLYDKITMRINPNYGLKTATNYCDESEIRALARRVATEIVEEQLTLVSIIIPNKNGIHYLKSLLPALKANTPYKAYEVIVVDNNSTDGSQKYIKSLGWSNLRLIESSKNLNFSESINLGAKYAKGEFLVFLNNDTIPLYGWLDELVKTIKNNPGCGVVGARLIYNKLDSKSKKGELMYPGCSIQHDGIKFRVSKESIIPYNLGKYKNPLIDSYDKKSEVEIPAVSAACMLTDKETFNKVDGFDANYYFGKEDVDYCLKVRKLKKKVLINRKSLLFHKEFSTQIKTSLSKRKKWRIHNEIIFKNKWEDYLHKKIWEELIFNKDRFWTENPLHIGFLVTEYSPHTTVGDLFSAKGLGEELKKRFGYKVSYFPRRPICEWKKIPESVDIVISMLEDFDIRKCDISPRTFKLAWIRGHIDEWLSRPWIHSYDGIIVTSKIAEEKVKKTAGEEKCWGIVPLGVPSYFISKDSEVERDIDVCFVGNIFDVPRDVVKCLDLTKNFNFHFYGKLEADSNHPWRPYHMGTVNHKDLPEVYQRSKIVIEDTAPFNKGTVNLRVYEAAASGALVIANETPGIEEVFGDSIEIYKDKEDLTKKIEYYLKNEGERKKKADKAKEIVINNHTFSQRAKEFRNILFKCFSLQEKKYFKN